MRKNMALFLIVFTCMTYARHEFVMHGAHYLSILSEKWLNDVERHDELIPKEKTYKGFIMSRDETWKAVDNVLKEHYNIDEKIYPSVMIVPISGLNYHKFRLVRVQKLPANEQVWMLFSQITRRAVSHKDKIDDPDWKKINLPELRHNNNYTFLLQKLKFGGAYPCTSSQKKRATNTIPSAIQDIDSTMALTIATTAAAECYGTEMTPIAARLMGNNNEHWLVYCFTTLKEDTVQLNRYRNILERFDPQGKDYKYAKESYDFLKDVAGQQKKCSEYFMELYDGGFLSWGGLGIAKADIAVKLKHCYYTTKAVSVLISRKTGQVLFMD